MMDIHKRFREVLDEIVNDWKEKDTVKGVYAYGAFARGTITANSVLDLCVIWDEQEAPVQLMAEHQNIRVDMSFLTPRDIEEVLDGKVKDSFKIAEVIRRLKEAKIVYDRDGDLEEWHKRAAEFTWPEKVIESMKQRALELLDNASEAADDEDVVSAVELVRNALFDLGRVIVMRNNQFEIIRPAEVLSEVRLLDPIAYQLFLRTFKLRGLEEEEIMDVLEDLRHWLEIAEERLAEREDAPLAAVEFLASAQRSYHTVNELTIEGDYELAVLEMRRAIHTLGRALLAMDGIISHNLAHLVDDLRENESDYYAEIFEEYGAFDFQIKGITRSIGEARFIAQRL